MIIEVSEKYSTSFSIAGQWLDNQPLPVDLLQYKAVVRALSKEWDTKHVYTFANCFLDKLEDGNEH